MDLRAVASCLLGIVAAAPAVAQCVAHSFPMGSGCGFSTPWGVSVAQCSGQPTIGNAGFGITSTSLCLGTPIVGALMVGTCLPSPIVFTNASTGLCISQAVCALYVNPIVVVPGTLQGGVFVYATPIPNAPQFVGLQVCVQAAHTCTGLNCVMGSNALRVTLM